MIRILFYSLTIALIFSCRGKQNKQPKNKTEVIEIYETFYDGDGYQKGDMAYYESKNFQDGKHLETFFYQPDGEVKGYEIIKFESDNKSNSIYYDKNDQPLSYYHHTYNKNGKKIRTKSYAASNDELLRVEEFIYDNGHLVKKEIKNALEVLQRSFVFDYDTYGNEIAMYVIEAVSKDTIATQNFEITAYYEDNSWKEKWGFQGEVPTTYQIRK